MRTHILAALDDWRARQNKRLSRADAIRQIVTERLLLEGLLPRFRAAKPDDDSSA